MKRILFFIISYIFVINSFAQYPSSCEVPTILRSEYEDLVINLAIRHISQSGTSDTTIIAIPSSYTDTIWRGLAAIYNAEGLPGRDEIFDIYCFGSHFNEFYRTDEVMVYLTPYCPWIDNWDNDIIETGYEELDQILSYYGFWVDYYSSFSDWATLKTDQHLNVNALSDIISQMDYIVSAYRNTIISVHNSVFYQREGDILYYEFNVIRNDWSESYTYTWNYAINLNTCEVTFLEGAGDNPINGMEYNCNTTELENIISVDQNSGCGSLTVNFSNMSDGGPIAWLWNFGDGASSTEQNPTHNYTVPGTYSVTLEVENSTSDNDSLTLEDFILVYENPEIHLDDDPIVCGGEMLDAGNFFIYYEWNGIEGERYYPLYEPGIYSVIAEDAYGCTATDEVEITTVYPELSAYITTTPCSNEFIPNGTSTAVIIGGTEPFGIIWSTGSTSNPHTSLFPGTYCAWIEDSNACEVYVCGDVGVVGNQITANVTYGYNSNVLFDSNVTELLLYFSDGENNVLLSQDVIENNDGSKIYYGLEDGDYFLESRLLNPENYNYEPIKCFQNAITVDDADTINLESNEIFIANINHLSYFGTVGSNSIMGNVSYFDDSKTYLPFEGAVVIYQEFDNEANYGLAITNELGEFVIEDVITNNAIKVFVSSFEYYEWIPAIIETGSSQIYNQNFIAENNMVYPEGWSRISEPIQMLYFSIYPNPANDFLSISNVPEGASVQIFDISGKRVLHCKMLSSNNIDISSLIAGQYIVLVASDMEIGVRKLIIE